jgi:putative aminopeptidase FrvX
MFTTSVKPNKATWERVKQCSKAAGYSSPEEFVENVIKKELAKLEDAESDEEMSINCRDWGAWSRLLPWNSCVA